MPEPTIDLTRELGAFIASFGDRDLPPAVSTLIKHGLIDSIGVMIAGAGAEAARIACDTLGDDGQESTLFLGPKRASAPTAALINGTAAHVLDFDDVAIQGHVSAVLMPAILAEAEAFGQSGAKVLSAYLVGYETWAELIGRQCDQVHRKGWHPTGVFGAIGAAAACAYLHGLPARQISCALAIAASQSGGVVANFGSMTKALHAGRAAQAGVVSARLARAGMTGSADALEGPTGLLQAVSARGRVDLSTPVHAGGTLHIERHGLTFKKVPTCLSTHRAVEGILRLRKRAALRPSEIDRIEVTLSRRNAEILSQHDPQTGLEARFSLEFAVAATLTVGLLGLAELEDAFVGRPDVRALMRRVVIHRDDREDPATGYAPYDEVRIRKTDGTLLSQRVDATPGSPGDPLSEDDLRHKFCKCLDHAGSGLDRDRLFGALLRLETAPDIRLITRPAELAQAS